MLYSIVKNQWNLSIYMCVWQCNNNRRWKWKKKERSAPSFRLWEIVSFYSISSLPFLTTSIYISLYLYALSTHFALVFVQYLTFVCGYNVRRMQKYWIAYDEHRLNWTITSQMKSNKYTWYSLILHLQNKYHCVACGEREKDRMGERERVWEKKIRWNILLTCLHT